MSIKKFAINNISSMAKYFGYEIISRWRVKEFPLTSHLRSLFEKYQIDVVIDVGANTGQFRDLLRNEVGFKGRILSFEPVKGFANQIKARSKSDNAWHVYDCALGRTPGEAKINVAKVPGLTSFLASRADELTGLWKEDSVTHTEMVQIRTLDDVLDEIKIDCERQRVYLKLDTQGFDLEVIKGAAKSMEHIIALQTEASIKPIYEGMPGYREALDNLAQLGFAISGMFPVTYDENMCLIEFDCVQINSRFLGR